MRNCSEAQAQRHFIRFLRRRRFRSFSENLSFAKSETTRNY